MPNRFLDYVRRPRVAAGVFILALLVYGIALVAIAVQASDASRKADAVTVKQAAKAAAELAAARQAEVTVCRRSVATAPTTLRILLSLRGVIEGQIAARRALIELDPEGTDPATAERKLAIRRDQLAIAGLDEFIERTEKQTPTDAKCDALAKKYGIGTQPKEEDA